MLEFKGKLFLYTTVFLNLEFDATKETVFISLETILLHKKVYMLLAA